MTLTWEGRRLGKLEDFDMGGRMLVCPNDLSVGEGRFSLTLDERERDGLLTLAKM